MQTDKITVKGWGPGREEPLQQMDSFSNAMGFDEKSSRKARLLAEETLSMMGVILEDFDAAFWIESTPECSCEIHLTAVAHMNYGKKQELISASTHKRNEATLGLVGRIKDFIEDSLYCTYSGIMLPTSDPHLLGSVAFADTHMWTMEQFRKDMDALQAEGEEAEIAELLEDLEKSLVAKIADEVQVAVRGNDIEMIVRKNF